MACPVAQHTRRRRLLRIKAFDGRQHSLLGGGEYSVKTSENCEGENDVAVLVLFVGSTQ